MFKDDLRVDIVALNLKNTKSSEVKVVYVFPPKENHKFMNCIMPSDPFSTV